MTEKESDAFEQSAERQREIAEYWTAERMAAVTPSPLPVISAETLERRRMAPDDAKVWRIPSGEPGGPAEPYPVDRNSRPYWNVGKLFFTRDDGKDDSGTAFFLGSNRILATAAHCVRNPFNGAYFTNFSFWRAGEGRESGGGWKGQQINVYSFKTWDAWTHLDSWGQPDMRWDYAFGVAAKDSGAGWLGFATGLPFQEFTSVGYPHAYANGSRMYAIAGAKDQEKAGQVRMFPNPMSNGASGGPWIGDVQSDPGSGNVAVGLNSHRAWVGEDEYVWSPFFDAKTYELLNLVNPWTNS